MSRHDCEICRGSGVIRLPLYRHVQAVRDFSAVASIEENSRSYSCPECADAIPQERVAVVEYHSLVNSRVDDPAYLDAAKDSAAHQLIASLLKGGFIRFKRGPNDIREFNFPVQATIGVVSPKTVADMEMRIAGHQEQLAREVIAEAEEQIRNWGSHYGQSSIQKQEAYRFLRAALTDILAKHASWKAA